MKKHLIKIKLVASIFALALISLAFAFETMAVPEYQETEMKNHDEEPGYQALTKENQAVVPEHPSDELIVLIVYVQDGEGNPFIEITLQNGEVLMIPRTHEEALAYMEWTTGRRGTIVYDEYDSVHKFVEDFIPEYQEIVPEHPENAIVVYVQDDNGNFFKEIHYLNDETQILPITNEEMLAYMERTTGSRGTFVYNEYDALYSFVIDFVGSTEQYDGLAFIQDENGDYFVEIKPLNGETRLMAVTHEAMLAYMNMISIPGICSPGNHN